MGKVTFIAILSLSVTNSELVVTPEEEGSLSSDYLLANAEVVSKYHQEGRCPEVKDEVRILRYFLQVGPDERKERNVGALVSPGHIIEHQYSWSDESWLPRRQRIE